MKLPRRTVITAEYSSVHKLESGISGFGNDKRHVDSAKVAHGSKFEFRSIGEYMKLGGDASFWS